jgi:pyruvate,water dikinase
MIPLASAEDPRRFGGKAAELSRALRAGLPVPRGYALDVDAVEAVVAGGGVTIRETAVRWAVRSSALGEDGEGASFAGMHVTKLHVPTHEVGSAVREVHASAHAPAALSYRRRMGVEGVPRMAVIVQEMIPSEVAGVLFTRHPMTGARERVVEASWGLGETVVSGLVTPDHFRLSPTGEVLEHRAGHKDIAIVWSEQGGTREEEIEAARHREPCLDRDRLAALVALAHAVEEAMPGDHDLEWAFARGSARPYLLQRRPITKVG